MPESFWSLTAVQTSALLKLLALCCFVVVAVIVISVVREAALETTVARVSESVSAHRF